MKGKLPSDYITGKILKSHLFVTILVALSATLSIVLNNLIVGMYFGADELTVYGLSVPILLLFTAFSGVFGNGGTIICSRYLGLGDVRAIRNNFTIATMITLVIGVLFTIIVMLTLEPLTVALGANSSLQATMERYVLGLALSSIPYLIAQNMLLYIRMDGSQKLALVAIAITIISDAVFAAWSANGELGMIGVGLAFGVSNLLCMAICSLHFLKKNRKLGFSKIYGMKSELSLIVSAGIPTAINRGSQTIKNFILNNFLMACVGASAVVALSVQTSVYQFTIALCTGYGLVVTMMCGIFYAERDKSSMESTLRVSIKSGIIVSAVVAAVIYIFAPEVVSMFIRDGGDPGECILAVRLFTLSLPTSTVCLIFLYMHQSLGNMVMCNSISITRGFLYIVLISILLYPVMGTYAVWISFVMADVLSIFTLFAIIRLKTGHFPRNWGDLVATPKGFSNVSEIYSASIHNNMDEVMELTSVIEKACLDKGVDSERSLKVALCIEEMAGNVVKFAFTESGEHCMDIRVLMQDGDLIFRLRDDGIAFNPLVSDSDDHLGIKVVKAMAKSISYNNAVGLNNLTVVV